MLPSIRPARANVTQVFIDPYTGQYLGQRSELSGLVGWANQLHRMFGNDGPKVQLPSLGHLISPSAYPDATIPVGIGNLWMELTAVWILVLLASGIYLWWPRAIEAAKPLLKIRWRKGGRIRWRDVHALTGVVIAVILICYVLSGMTWSRYWGENWRAFSSTVAPSTEIDAPSTPAKMGDYDRLGRRIAWAATDDPVYASQPDGPCAARLSFADIDRIAKGEHMVPGYAIIPPSDSAEDGETVYGSYTVVNAGRRSCPSSARCISTSSPGRRSPTPPPPRTARCRELTSFGIAMHMGNQFGLLTRISATVACLGVLTSVLTGLLMWWKRRPAGSAGLPGPAGEATRSNTPKRTVIAVSAAAVVLGVVYPVFGVSLLLVLAVDALLTRRKNSSRNDGPDLALADLSVRADDDGDEVKVGALQ